MNTTHGEKTAGVSVENNHNLSKFSLSECLTYVEICKSNGDEIRNSRALAMTLHKTGSADSLIEAVLHPEPIPEQVVEYDEPETIAPTPLPESVLRYRLGDFLLEDLSESELHEQENYYTPEDWAWLMNELEKVNQ